MSITTLTASTSNLFLESATLATSRPKSATYPDHKALSDTTPDTKGWAAQKSAQYQRVKAQNHPRRSAGTRPAPRDNTTRRGNTTVNKTTIPAVCTKAAQAPIRVSTIRASEQKQSPVRPPHNSGKIRTITPGQLPSESAPLTPLFPRTGSQQVSNLALKNEEYASAPSSYPEPPDPYTWSATLSQTVVEVLLGRRPLMQLARWLTPELYQAFQSRINISAATLDKNHTFRPCFLKSIHVYRVDTGSTQISPAEVSALVFDGTRLRALALRLEAFRGRWKVCALEIG